MKLPLYWRNRCVVCSVEFAQDRSRRGRRAHICGRQACLREQNKWRMRGQRPPNFLTNAPWYTPPDREQGLGFTSGEAPQAKEGT